MKLILTSGFFASKTLGLGLEPMEATDITGYSAVLWGYVNPFELIPGVDFGIILSTLENPSLQNGICLVSAEIDKNNKFEYRI